MTTKSFEILDIQDDDQEINISYHASAGGNEGNSYLPNFANSAIDGEQTERNRGSQGGESGPTVIKYSNFMSFEYYQQFFNVETEQVKERIKLSVVPKQGTDYLQSHIRPNPDLYGPIWIALTLVLTTAVTGNLSNYFQSENTYLWRYDFHKITLCTSMVFSYAVIVPVCMWGFLLWRNSHLQLTLLEVVCLYGYSLAVFVPVSVLWLLPFAPLQWLLAIVAAILSGCVLVKTITPSIQHEGKRAAMTVGGVIIALHAALALGFILYFF